ncbi:hypothetical protein K431DRAFT_280559 [Polychaeton citri CBS 116435]|uniref:AhpC/TSA antioxidant enzyme-domain-containing protein n=1 Tax=Polychaeton citri CBS 116435 TaxID=1314669 RepID=A0A9P4UUK1_9PEZI|nr:hypothetical protein K431DRAFT_280559 [Polychaeton citri CBS 116435]
MASGAADQAAAPSLPDAPTLQLAGELPIQDKDGLTHRFSDLYTSPGQHLVIFIRHFFCGNCEEYIRALAAQLSPSTLGKETSLPSSIVIIGCGSPKLIADYASRTDCPYPIYADPDRKLYKVLGMGQNLAQGEKKPEYIERSTPAIVVSSILNGIKSGTGALQGGNFSQNGGEWLFETVVGGKVGVLKWAHRMANSADHAEVKDLKEVLGIKA